MKSIKYTKRWNVAPGEMRGRPCNPTRRIKFCLEDIALIVILRYDDGGIFKRLKRNSRYRRELTCSSKELLCLKLLIDSRQWLYSLKKNRVNNSLHLWSEDISLVEEWISLDSYSSRVKIHYSTSGISSGLLDIHSKRSDHWGYSPGSDVSDKKSEISLHF